MAKHASKSKTHLTPYGIAKALAMVALLAGVVVAIVFAVQQIEKKLVVKPQSTTDNHQAAVADENLEPSRSVDYDEIAQVASATDTQHTEPSPDTSQKPEADRIIEEMAPMGAANTLAAIDTGGCSGGSDEIKYQNFKEFATDGSKNKLLKEVQATDKFRFTALQSENTWNGLKSVGMNTGLFRESHVPQPNITCSKEQFETACVPLASVSEVFADAIGIGSA